MKQQRGNTECARISPGFKRCPRCAQIAAASRDDGNEEFRCSPNRMKSAKEPSSGNRACLPACLPAWPRSAHEFLSLRFTRRAPMLGRDKTRVAEHGEFSSFHRLQEAPTKQQARAPGFLFPLVDANKGCLGEATHTQKGNESQSFSFRVFLRVKAVVFAFPHSIYLKTRPA